MTTQTILNFIERRMNELYGKLPDSETMLNGTASAEDYRITGAYTELERLEKEIRTGMSDESDIASELRKYIKENFTIEKDVLDKYSMEEKDYMYSMDEGDMLKMVSHFAEWKMQQLLKNAVTTVVTDFEYRSTQAPYDTLTAHAITTVIDSSDVKNGDVVKVIVMKYGKE